MAFPTSITGISTGHPLTGLAPGVVFVAKYDGSTAPEKYQYGLWDAVIRGGNVDAYWSKNKELWIWADCSQRWWKVIVDDAGIDAETTNDLTGYIRPGIKNDFPAGMVGLSEQYSFENDVLIPGKNQVGRPFGIKYATWDSVKSEWVVKVDFCDVDKSRQTPVDDCARYGINCPDELPSGKIFTKIDVTDILPRQSEIFTYGMWSGGVGNLTTFYTCSQDPVSMSFHRVIYNTLCNSCDSEAQFSIAYGNDDGSGSRDMGGYDWLTPTNAIYGQYRGLCLNPNENKFKIGIDEVNDFYVINVKLARMKERIDEGNIELNLAHLSGSEFIAGGGSENAHTGSNVSLAGNGKVLRLIDDSRIDFSELSNTALSGAYSEMLDVNAHRVSHGGKIYYMVSGSLEDGIYNKSNPHVYGLLYPQLGVIILDAKRLDMSASFGTVRGTEVDGDNSHKLYLSISGAAQYTDASGDILGFRARRKEVHWSEYYFVRVKNSDYNFTNNPTFVSGSEYYVKDDFINNPKVYISTIGLYNERKELLAVGKISRPIQKSFTSEALFKVKLKY